MPSHKSLYSTDYGFFVASTRGYRGIRNRFRTRTLIRIIRPAREEKILEIGCNGGSLISQISRFSDYVVGIDVNKDLVERLKSDKIQVMSATNLEFEKNDFDKVCAFEVIEHIPAIGKVFLEVHRVLKPKGKFIVSFPFEVIRGQAALFDAVRVFKNPLYARKLHVHRLTPQKIREIVRNMPFRIDSCTVKFIPHPAFLMTLEKTDD